MKDVLHKPCEPLLPLYIMAGLGCVGPWSPSRLHWSPWCPQWLPWVPSHGSPYGRQAAPGVHMGGPHGVTMRSPWDPRESTGLRAPCPPPLADITPIQSIIWACAWCLRRRSRRDRAAHSRVAQISLERRATATCFELMPP